MNSMLTREFVEDGFRQATGQIQITWEDPTLSCWALDFGGDSLTTSGYPRVIRRWRRGKPLADGDNLAACTDRTASMRQRIARPGFERHPQWARLLERRGS